MLADVWKYTHQQYEAGHWFIQWMFPSDEMSSINPYAPVVTEEVHKEFNSNTKLKLKLKRSFIQFLDFIGISLSRGVLSIKSNASFYRTVQRRNHNLQRITRVLRSLNILGLKEYANLFYAFLLKHKDCINSITLDYWSKAMTAELGHM